MASKRTTKPKPPPSREGLTQVQFRMPDELMARLDAYVESLNEGRVNKLNRSDVVRGVVDWVVRTRPDWETRGTK